MSNSVIKLALLCAFILSVSSGVAAAPATEKEPATSTPPETSKTTTAPETPSSQKKVSPPADKKNPKPQENPKGKKAKKKAPVSGKKGPSPAASSATLTKEDKEIIANLELLLLLELLNDYELFAEDPK